MTGTVYADYAALDDVSHDCLFWAKANFFEDDLVLFAKLIKAQLGIDVVRYPGNLPLKVSTSTSR